MGKSCFSKCDTKIYFDDIGLNLTYHRAKSIKPLDSDSLDYDQHNYTRSPDYSPENDGFCLNDGVCFFQADTYYVACICPYSYVAQRCEVCVVNTVDTVALWTSFTTTMSSTNTCLNCRRNFL